MEGVSRRTFLKSSGGAAAGAAVMAAIGGGAAHASQLAPDDGAAAQVPVVAYIQPGGRSKITVMVGDREIVHHDRDLVRRLLTAAK
jgi:hypothetical protein